MGAGGGLRCSASRPGDIAPENEARDIPLLGSLQNQLFIFRPDEAHNLVLVDGQQWTYNLRCTRKPLGRGIDHWTADQRVRKAGQWVNGEPPEPDWLQLDNLGNYMEQLGVPAEEPEEDDLVIEDFRFEALALSDV